MRAVIFGILSSVLIAFLTTVLFVNCSSKVTDSPAAKVSALELLSTTPYSFISQNYEIKNYKLNSSDGAVYFQVIPGCSDLCPVVVVSMPYNGIPWTNDAGDLRWSTNFPTGALTDDVDGPNFVVGSGQQIAFYQSSIAVTVGFGAIFLPSKVTAVLVYNRFYLGRKMDNYVNDFVSVVNELHRFSYIDTSKMGFLGSSLGGFVSSHASRKTAVKPLAIVGITPLINLKSEQTEMSTVSARITSNPTSLLASQNFYNSYLRRMAGVDVNFYTSQTLANENTTSKILVIHDTWDTIVSID